VSRVHGWVSSVVASPAEVIAAAALVVGLLWWQWPLIAGDTGRTDVVVIADDFLTAVQTPVTNRIHENGDTMRWATPSASWCGADAAVHAAVDQFSPTTVVLSFGSADGCDAGTLTRAVAAAGSRHVVIVTQPGRSGIEAVADHGGATLVDPTRYVGDQLTAVALPCQWWDACAVDGAVEVRNADGSLTEAGGDRVARLIVAELP
jgi:hypothetical protein